MGNEWHSSIGCVMASLIEPIIEATAFDTLTFDMTARQADNIRAIATALVLHPPSRLIETVPPQIS